MSSGKSRVESPHYPARNSSPGPFSFPKKEGEYQPEGQGENPEDFILIIERMKDNEFFKKNRHLYAPKYLFKKENFEMYLNTG